MLEQAVTATKGVDQMALAKYIRESEHKTIVGANRYRRNGEWAEGRALLVQFTGIKDCDIEQFRLPGKQVILAPDKYKTAQIGYPFEKARKST